MAEPLGIFTEKEKEQIYLEYRDKVYAYIRGKVADPHEAEDLQSCVFVKVFQGLGGFDRTRASLSTWIYTIAKNTVYDFFRLRRVHEELDTDRQEAEGLQGRDLAEGLVLAEELERLSHALEKLHERERDLIILHYYKEYTLKQIAEMMGMSYGNAKVVHKKALKALEREMQDSGGHASLHFSRISGETGI